MGTTLCTPLIDYLDLLKLKSLIDKNKLNKPVISVSKYNAPIEWAFTLNKKNKMLFAKYKKTTNTISRFKDSYYDVGSITVFDAKNLETNNNFYKGNFYGFELPPQKNIDIDNQNDWEFAEKLLKLKNL